MCRSVLQSPWRPGTLLTISPNFPWPHACCSFPGAYRDVSSRASFPAPLATARSVLPGPVPLCACVSCPLSERPLPVLSPQTHHQLLGRHSPGPYWFSCLVFYVNHMGREDTKARFPAPASLEWLVPFLAASRYAGMLEWISTSQPINQNII